MRLQLLLCGTVPRNPSFPSTQITNVMVTDSTRLDHRDKTVTPLNQVCESPGRQLSTGPSDRSVFGHRRSSDTEVVCLPHLPFSCMKPESSRDCPPSASVLVAVAAPCHPSLLAPPASASSPLALRVSKMSSLPPRPRTNLDPRHRARHSGAGLSSQPVHLLPHGSLNGPKRLRCAR